MDNFPPGKRVFIACPLNGWIVLSATISWTDEYLEGYRLTRDAYGNVSMFMRIDRMFSTHKDAAKYVAVIKVMGS